MNQQTSNNVPPGSTFPRRPWTIMIVDDEPALRIFARDILEDAGYVVRTAASGEEALEHYREHAGEVDLVILDLYMPGIDGAQTYLAMKAIRPGIRAFICSGYITDPAITGLLKEHGLTAIGKPFEVDEFLQVVEATLQGR